MDTLQRRRFEKIWYDTDLDDPEKMIDFIDGLIQDNGQMIVEGYMKKINWLESMLEKYVDIAERLSKIIVEMKKW